MKEQEIKRFLKEKEADNRTILNSSVERWRRDQRQETITTGICMVLGGLVAAVFAWVVWRILF